MPSTEDGGHDRRGDVLQRKIAPRVHLYLFYTLCRIRSGCVKGRSTVHRAVLYRRMAAQALSRTHRTGHKPVLCVRYKFRKFRVNVSCEGVYIHKFTEKLSFFDFGSFFTVSYCEEARNNHCNVNLAAIVLVDWFLWK